MAENTKRRLTPLESLIMDVVWDTEKCTVREVQESLEARKSMAYNTVLTMMRILRDKGFLASERDGRTDIYRPLVSREQMGSRGLRDVLDSFFSGSAPALVSQLLDSGDLSAEEIRDIRRKVNGKLSAKGGQK